MTDRLCKLNERHQAARALLHWFGIVCAGAVIAAIALTNAHAAEPGGAGYGFHVTGASGWETTIVLAADLDGDHKPDFVVRVGEQETLLTSSRAKPGLNPPAAVLAQLNEGC